MASNPVVNSLIFAGSVAESASIQAQGIAGGLTFLLPNTAPIQGQLMSVTAINGNNVFLGWASQQSLSNIPLSDLAQSGATTGEFIAWNGTTWAPSSFVPGSGTVTSVALTVPSWLSVAGSPITTSGTLAVTAASGQPQNQVLATPNGSSGALSVRALVAGDIPALPYDASGAAAAVAAQLPSTIAPVTSNFLTGYNAGTHTFSAGQPAFTDLSGSLAISMINSKVGNGNAVQITNTGQTIVAGDVVTYDATGNTQDSGTLLSALALAANLPSSIGPTANEFVTAYNSGTHSFTLAQPSAANLSNGTTGSGAVVLATSPTFVTGLSTPAVNNVNQIAALSGSGLDISSTGTDLIQINGNSVGIINVQSTGVEINNNTSSAFVHVPTTGGVQIHAAAADSIHLTTATGVFDFFGTGGGMSLATQNATIAIDANGKISIQPSTTGPQALNINLANVQIFANNAAAITGGLVAGDLYRTGADPDFLAIVH